MSFSKVTMTYGIGLVALTPFSDLFVHAKDLLIQAMAGIVMVATALGYPK